MKFIKLKLPKRSTNNEGKNSFPIFIIGSLVVAMFLSGFSLWLYNESGAAQLDLSRPSYQEAREEAKKEEEEENSTSKDFASDGKIDKNTIDEFSELYEERLNKIQADAFKSNPLSDESLNISEQ